MAGMQTLSATERRNGLVCTRQPSEWLCFMSAADARFQGPGFQWISVGSGIEHAEGGGTPKGQVFLVTVPHFSFSM